MAVYILTGKLGNGKSLVSVGRIRDKLQSGCMVATNLDLNLVPLIGASAKNCRVLRVPDKPNADDLHAIGNANLSYDESRNGLLVLDELGTWFNSRNWQDKSRGPVNDWFLHARKLGWDLILIVQDITLIDSQARAAIAEHTVFCKRLDNIHIPFFGTLYKILTLGQRLRLPRIHVGKVVYGTTEQDVLSDRWVYRGTDLFSCYDTKQVFLHDYRHGLFSMLPPWHTFGRHQIPRDWKFYMRMTKIYWKRFSSPLAAACGLLAGVALTASMAFASVYHDMKKAAEPVPEIKVAPVEEAKKEAPPVPMVDPLPLRLASLKIVGAVQMGPNFYYEYAEADAKEGFKGRMNSRDLIASGIDVLWFSDCKSELKYKGQSITVYCL